MELVKYKEQSKLLVKLLDRSRKDEESTTPFWRELDVNSIDPKTTCELLSRLEIYEKIKFPFFSDTDSSNNIYISPRIYLVSGCIYLTMGLSGIINDEDELFKSMIDVGDGVMDIIKGDEKSLNSILTDIDSVIKDYREAFEIILELSESTHLPTLMDAVRYTGECHATWLLEKLRTFPDASEASVNVMVTTRSNEVGLIQ